MKRIYPIIGLGIVLLVNFLANYIPIGGNTTGQLSDTYDSLFTPAGFTFSIWGLIYLFLISYVIFQVLPKNKDKAIFDQINPWFLVNCAANASWIFAWHYELIPISLGIMTVILGSLIMIYKRIRLYHDNSFINSLFIKFPFSIYIGWITVATIANISILQSAMGWNDFYLLEQEWTFIKLGLAGAIGAAMILQQNDKAFGFVIAWAAYGIFKNQQGLNGAIEGAAISIFILTLIGIVITTLNEVYDNKNLFT